MQQSKYDREAYISFADMSQTLVWAVFGGFVGAGLLNALIFHKFQPVPFWVTFAIMETVLQLVLWVPYALWERGRAQYLEQLPKVTTSEPTVVPTTHQPGIWRRVDGKIINKKR